MSIIRHLSRVAQPAKAIMKAAQMSNEDTYRELVSLEARGIAAVEVAHKSRAINSIGWYLTDAGERARAHIGSGEPK